MRWTVQIRIRDQWRIVQYFEFEHLQRARASVDWWREQGRIARLWDLEQQRAAEMADPRPATDGLSAMAGD